jgi:hypothetical protein
MKNMLDSIVTPDNHLPFIWLQFTPTGRIAFPEVVNELFNFSHLPIRIRAKCYHEPRHKNDDENAQIKIIDSIINSFGVIRRLLLVTNELDEATDVAYENDQRGIRVVHILVES